MGIHINGHLGLCFLGDNYLQIAPDNLKYHLNKIEIVVPFLQ